MKEREAAHLDSDNTERSSTEWIFKGFSDVDVKVVFDRQPLMGTGPLPDWLRNLAHRRGMVALDTFQDNLYLWRCISVHHGARLHRSTKAAPELPKSFFIIKTVPNGWLLAPPGE